MIVFHGTHAEFDHFSEEYFGSRENMSANGALGVWFAREETHASVFGGRLLSIEATPERSIALSVTDMRLNHETAERSDDPLAWFRVRRAALLARGYQAIDVIERDGSSAMGVILDPACIRSVTELSRVPRP